MSFATGHTKGLEALERKWMKVPEVIRTASVGQNQENARDFMQKVASIIPVDPGAKHEHLVATLRMGEGSKPGGVQVSIGGPEAPYPAHLEYGHMDHGKHVRAEPFWWPVWRLFRKGWRARQATRVRGALRALFSHG